MKYHLMSGYGEGCGLMERIQDEGNECTVQIMEEDYKQTYDGILEKSDEPDEDAIIIVDTSGFGEKADEYRREGFHVFGGSEFADKLEDDRNFGIAFMQKHGIQVPDSKTFRTFVQAEDWLKAKKPDSRYVFKPNGSLPCKLTYCAENRDDLISYLRFVGRYFSSKIDDFILQTFVEGPIVSTEFWCGPRGFIYPANHTVEVKKFLNDNLGPSTGCQGNLVWIAESDEVVDLLEGIEDSLVKEGYVGPIDLNAILSNEGPKGLEWTPRFGLDAMPTFLHLVEGDIGQLIADIVLGQVKDVPVTDAIAGGVRITIPPYPIEPTTNMKAVLKQSPNTGIPIEGLDDAYLYEVMVFDNQLVHSPGTGVIAVVSDVCDEAEDCLSGPYEILEKANIPDKQYRTDLCEVLPDMCREACEALECVKS